MMVLLFRPHALRVYYNYTATMTAATSNLERSRDCLWSLLVQYCNNFQLIVTVIILIIEHTR